MYAITSVAWTKEYIFIIVGLLTVYSKPVKSVS